MKPARVRNCRRGACSGRVSTFARAPCGGGVLRSRRAGWIWTGKFRRETRRRLRAWLQRTSLVPCHDDGRDGDRSRRSGDAPGATADAGAIVVIVTRRRVVRLSARGRVMMLGRRVRGVLRARDCGSAVRRTRVHHAWLPHDEREPDGEQNRDRSEPGRPAHNRKMAPSSIWFQ